MSAVVWHLVDAMGTGSELWGKERVIADVLAAQRARGLDARLICFTPGGLGAYCALAGFAVEELEQVPHRLPLRSLPALLAILRREPGAVLHTHGYKANVVGRLARLAGAPLARLVATCHGWPNETRATTAYNVLDRWTAFLSDTTTVPDGRMVARFPGFVRARTLHVANAIPDRALPGPAQRAFARRSLGLPVDGFVVGTLGRLTQEKGVADALRAVADPRCAGIVWAFAGSGPLAWLLEGAGPAARGVGYVTPSTAFLDALDAYVQVSHSEGLSLGLLEAMRAGLPIVATAVGATAFAVGDEREALLVPARDHELLVEAVVRLRDDELLRGRLGRAARQRFEQAFRIERQVGEFDRAYGAAP